MEEPPPKNYGAVEVAHFLESLDNARACLVNNYLMEIIGDGSGRLVREDRVEVVMNKDTVKSVKAIRCKTDFKRGGFSVCMVDDTHYTLFPLHIALVYDLIPPPNESVLPG
jgi:hypothetical protein